MAMTDQEHKALRSYCAFILKEYGFQLSPNDPVIPALYIIHREMQLNNHNNKAIAILVKDASAKMNSKVFNFNSPGEAWKFQMAVALKWFFGGLLILGLGAIGIWYWSMINDMDRARNILQGSENVPELLKRMDKDKEGYYFIDFKQATGSSIQSFSEFEKVNASTIRIYLGKESK